MISNVISTAKFYFFFNFTDPGEITFIESHKFETGETLGEVFSELIGDRL